MSVPFTLLEMIKHVNESKFNCIKLPNSSHQILPLKYIQSSHDLVYSYITMLISIYLHPILQVSIIPPVLWACNILSTWLFTTIRHYSIIPSLHSPFHFKMYLFVSFSPSTCLISGTVSSFLYPYYLPQSPACRRWSVNDYLVDE
jgi:hypothetical protein